MEFSAKQLIELYHKTGLISNIKEVKSNEPSNKTLKANIRLEGIISVDNKEITLLVEIDNFFPNHKPQYYLNSYDDLGFIPHISHDCIICYMQEEGILMDIDNIYGIIYDSLNETIRTLEEGYYRKNEIDFVNEFEYYWNENSCISEKKIYSLVSLIDEVKKIEFFEIENKIFIADSVDNIVGFFKLDKNKLSEKGIFKKEAIYIPLKEDAKILPPKYSEFWSREGVSNNILNNITSDNKQKLINILNGKNSHSLLMGMLKQPNGSKAIFGINYSNISNKKFHPLLHPNNYCKVEPLSVTMRMDKEYILPRGGASTELNKKKVAIIGCGSLGGYIAPELIKSGILNLTLIDHDRLSIDNIYRHFLGHSYLGQFKVSGLKIEIEKNLPYSRVEVLPEKIEQIIIENKLNFSDFDLVIIATGEPTINFYLNKYFKKNNNLTPVIFTWLEPYGLGGHALLTNNNRKTGCYHCIYNRLVNKASFAEKDQKFTKSVSGCGSLYTPYGSSDSIRTAILTVKLAVDVLIGKEIDNPILSWKGDNTEFEKEGFKTTSRYSQTSEELFINRYNYKNDACKICK